jgi:uncharacterized UBP type Zn finger protein
MNYLPPIGLPNIGATCWLNSILQLILSCPALLQTIMQISNTIQSDNLHLHLQRLFHAIQQRNKPEIVHHYQKLHQLIITIHPIFNQSSLNDCNEVLIYLINKLHDEVAVLVPEFLRSQAADTASKIILRDFDNKLSHYLETALICTKRMSSDQTEIIETNFCLYVEPKLLEDNTYCIQQFINDQSFVNLPHVLFMNLIINQQCACRIPDILNVQNQKYKLCSIIFFIPNAAHYVCAIRHKNEFVLPSESNDEQEPKKLVDGWFFTNDHFVSFIPQTNFHNVVQNCFPSLIAYEQVFEA